MPLGPGGDYEIGPVVDAMLERADRQEAAEEHLARYLRRRFDVDLAELGFRCREVEYLCWVFYRWSAWRGRLVSGQDSGWVVCARPAGGATAERWEIAEFGHGISAEQALADIRRLLGRNLVVNPLARYGPRLSLIKIR